MNHNSKTGGVASLVGLDLGGAGSNGCNSLASLKSRNFIDFDNKRNAIPLMLASKWNKKEDTLYGQKAMIKIRKMD